MIIPSLLLIHGALTGAWVWRSWRRYLGDLGWQVNVLDLRGHGRSMPTDLASVTMEDYVADLASVTRQIEAAEGVHPILGGWSMGAMVAMMYAAQPLPPAPSPLSGRGSEEALTPSQAERGSPPALLLLSPSPPLEVAGRAPIEVIRQVAGDVLKPSALGVFPDDREHSREVLFDLTEDELTWFLEESASAEESGIAVRQVLRGISIPKGAIESPSLVLYGESEVDQMRDQARALAAYLEGDVQGVASAGHWGLVGHDTAVAKAAPAVDTWLREKLQASTSS